VAALQNNTGKNVFPPEVSVLPLRICAELSSAYLRRFVFDFVVLQKLPAHKTLRQCSLCVPSEAELVVVLQAVFMASFFSPPSLSTGTPSDRDSLSPFAAAVAAQG
jgi:hypothetical protein